MKMAKMNKELNDSLKIITLEETVEQRLASMENEMVSFLKVLIKPEPNIVEPKADIFWLERVAYLIYPDPLTTLAHIRDRVHVTSAPMIATSQFSTTYNCLLPGAPSFSHWPAYIT